MIGLLRRFQPRNPLLGTVYWLSLAVAAFALLFGLFFLLDSVFGLAPFDEPAV